MFQIAVDEELTPTRLGKIIKDFQEKDLPILKKYHKYWDGKHRILNKVASDNGKPCNKVVTNFCADITDNYKGYLAGIPITYSNNSQDISELIDVLNYNDVEDEDVNYLEQALIYGVAYEINYIDIDAKQRFKILDSRQCIPIYDNTLDENLLYVIRFWKEKLISNTPSTDQYIYYAEVYGNDDIKRYKSTEGYNSFTLIEEEPHYYKQVPITIFSLNKEEKSIFDCVISLQDAYNELLSDEIDDFQAFADAYLLIKGMTAAEEDLEDMKSHRCLLLDEDGDASYLTKSISDTQITNMLSNIEDKIYTISKSPNFNDEKFFSQSGIALRYKLVGLETKASSIEKAFRKALTKRIELISAILNITDSAEEEMWRDTEIIFTRNLPLNMDEIIKVVTALRGVVSTKTLLSQIPFVKNIDEELKKLADEKQANMELYNFGNISEEDDEE